MSKSVRAFVFAVIVMSFVLVACGAPAAETQAVEPTAEPTEAPTEEALEDPMAMYAPNAVEGDVVTAGSHRVPPFRAHG